MFDASSVREERLEREGTSPSPHTQTSLVLLLIVCFEASTASLECKLKLYSDMQSHLFASKSSKLDYPNTLLCFLQSFTTTLSIDASSNPPRSQLPISLLLTPIQTQLAFNSSKEPSKQSNANAQLQQVNISLVPPQPTRSMQPINSPLVLYPPQHLPSLTRTLLRNGTSLSRDQTALQPSSSVFAPFLGLLKPFRVVCFRLLSTVFPAD